MGTHNFTKLLHLIQKCLQGDTLAGLEKLDPEVQAEYDKILQRRANAFEVGAGLTGLNTESASIGDGPGQVSKGGAVGMAVAGQALSQGVQALDNAFMGDKNFGAQSQAIDNAVHGVSGALMKTGNPYCMAAAGIIEGVNFLDKAGGQTTPGYEVNINNSGYSSNLTHMESKSSRSGFFNPKGGGIGNGLKLKRQLEDRNNKVRMALDAAEISADQQFEQEARMNSISNTIMNNREALAGGYATNTLGE